MHICLFDIDGTLISTAGAGTAAMRRALAHSFQVAEPTSQVVTAGRTDWAITHDFLTQHEIPRTVENKQRFIASYLQHLPESLASHPTRVLPGIVKLLSALAQRPDVVLGLLTGNVAAGAKTKLAHCGLWDYFATGGFGDQAEDRNAVAHAAMAAVEKAYGPVDRRKVWVLGDTPHDVTCGRSIGANVVAVATGMYSADQLRQSAPDRLYADFVAHDFAAELFD